MNGQLQPVLVLCVWSQQHTVPAIIAVLGGPRLQDVCDGDDAHLFTLVRTGNDRAAATTHGLERTDPPSKLRTDPSM